MPVVGGLWAETEERADHDVVRLHGALSLATVPRARGVLDKLLADRGAVVVDLAELTLLWHPAVEVFPTALAAAGGWPAARMVLTGAGPGLTVALLTLRVTRTVPMVDDLALAAARLACRPDRISRHRDLPVHPSSPGVARALVRETCTDWDIVGMEEPAALVATELVTNSLLHAHTSCRVTLTLDDRGLRVGVRDYAMGPTPRPRPVDVTAGAGRGLHLVAMTTRTWGVRDHADGKTVWALISPAG